LEFLRGARQVAARARYSPNGDLSINAARSAVQFAPAGLYFDDGRDGACAGHPGWQIVDRTEMLNASRIRVVRDRRYFEFLEPS
jgi:hypothetical protein